jgi:hypothetical protein
MNAWLPQASYPCGNFSVTSNQNLSGHKGSIGHAFAVCIRTGNQNQADISPFSLREISVLSESTVGHLRCSLADVPPQPNSPSEFFLQQDQHLHALLPQHHNVTVPHDEVSGTTVVVVVFHLRRSSHVYYTPQVIPQKQTRVKLNRVFFPRLYCQARSLGCGFARWRVGTVGISLIHSCASLIR